MPQAQRALGRDDALRESCSGVSRRKSNPTSFRFVMIGDVAVRISEDSSRKMYRRPRFRTEPCLPDKLILTPSR